MLCHYSTGRAGAEETLALLPGDGHCVAQCDLSDPQAASSLVDDAVTGLGGLDVVCINHGLYEETPFEETDDPALLDSMERIMAINLYSPAVLAHRAAKVMVQTRGGDGSIVFVSSRGAYRGEPLAPAYGASKAALNSLTGSLAQALGPYRIRVAGVAPGFTATAMAQPVLDDPIRGPAVRGQSTWNRVGNPREVAECAYFLASEGGTWCTGAVLDCNGASYLR